MNFPRLYAILDTDSLTARSINFIDFAEDLFSAGVPLVQYRNKSGNARSMLTDAAVVKNLRADKDVKLIMNDRADLTLLCGFDGVHLGQEDLRVEDTRKIVGPAAIVGVSTHSIEQVIKADNTSCNYIAFGPIFPTMSKNNPDPAVGLTGLQAARAATRKPLVAIGGIKRENCRFVLEAGADSVAIISGLLPTAVTSDVHGAVCRIAEGFLASLAP